MLTVYDSHAFSVQSLHGNCVMVVYSACKLGSCNKCIIVVHWACMNHALSIQRLCVGLLFDMKEGLTPNRKRKKRILYVRALT